MKYFLMVINNKSNKRFICKEYDDFFDGSKFIIKNLEKGIRASDISIIFGKEIPLSEDLDKMETPKIKTSLGDCRYYVNAISQKDDGDTSFTNYPNLESCKAFLKEQLDAGFPIKDVKVMYGVAVDVSLYIGAYYFKTPKCAYKTPKKYR